MRLRTKRHRRDGESEVVLLQVYTEDLSTGDLTEVPGKFLVLDTARSIYKLTGGLVYAEEQS